MKGVVTQFGAKGYGFIKGDDDGEKYFVHQQNIDNKSRLKLNTPVVFTPQSSDKGLVAMQVKSENGVFNRVPLNDVTVKILLALLLIVQIVIIYKVFFLV